VHQFVAHGVRHLLVPVFSFERDNVCRRLEQIAREIIGPYQRGA
jgi:hypothetical protein